MNEDYIKLAMIVVPVIFAMWRNNISLGKMISKSVKDGMVETSAKVDRVLDAQDKNFSIMKDQHRETKIDHKELKSEMHENKDQLKDQITKFHYDMTRGYDDLKHRISSKDK